MSIKLSVIIPIYNSEMYLRPCIESVLTQTLHEIEIILINDGSNDSSGTICKEYVNSDARVLYYEKQNEGAAAARQDGIDRASGEYIGFVDSDDICSSDMYEMMYCAAKENNDADIVMCSMFRSSKIKPFRKGYFNRKQIEGEVIPRTLPGYGENGNNDEANWSLCSRIFRKSTLLDNNVRFDPKLRRCQDLQFTFEATIYAKGFVFLEDNSLYHIREVPFSLSRSYTKNMWPLIKLLLYKISDDIKKVKNVDLSKRYDESVFILSIAVIENEVCKSNSPIFNRLTLLKEVVFDEMLQRHCVKIDENLLGKAHRKYHKHILGRNIWRLYFVVWFHSRFLLWWKNMKRNFWLFKFYRILLKRGK